MQTKHIYKLEELKGFEWEYKGESFCLEMQIQYILPPQDDLSMVLVHKNRQNRLGFTGDRRLMNITEKNLTELKFYGLNVTLNEKPKLTRQERDFLETIQGEIHLARGLRSTLVLSKAEPIKTSMGFGYGRDSELFALDKKTFPFITWESGKAWSKAELMELEVEE